MPQVFKIGSYWVYFWANEMSLWNRFMSMWRRARPVPMRQRYGSPGQENAT